MKVPSRFVLLASLCGAIMPWEIGFCGPEHSGPDQAATAAPAIRLDSEDETPIDTARDRLGSHTKRWN